MTIRLATPQDARQIAMIHVEAWKAAYRGVVPDEFLDSLSVDARELTWRERLEGGRSITWVAHDSKTTLGWISARAGEILAVYVRPEHWGQGVGRRLCETVYRHLLLEGCSEVTLWVLKDNARAVRFYRSNGFVLDAGGEKIVELGGKPLTEIRFRKVLSV